MAKTLKILDGLGCSIMPGTRGASAGKGLPPRKHAVHKALYDSLLPLSRKQIEDRLTKWGYDPATVNVTAEHLRTLNKVLGFVILDESDCYQLTPEARSLLDEGHFSGVLH